MGVGGEGGGNAALAAAAGSDGPNSTQINKVSNKNKQTKILFLPFFCRLFSTFWGDGWGSKGGRGVYVGGGGGDESI